MINPSFYEAYSEIVHFSAVIFPFYPSIGLNFSNQVEDFI